MIEKRYVGEYVDNVYFIRKPYNLERVLEGPFFKEQAYRVRIDKIIYLNDDNFKEFTSDFYIDRENMLEHIGGYDHVRDFVHVCAIENQKTKARIYINTEGFNYCRYVGVMKNFLPPVIRERKGGNLDGK